MACPMKLKGCKQTLCFKLRGGWFCTGVWVSKKMPPKVPRFDRCVLCIKSSLSPSINRTFLRPEEALMVSGGLSVASMKWLDDFPPYNQWVVENDPTP